MSLNDVLRCLDRRHQALERSIRMIEKRIYQESELADEARKRAYDPNRGEFRKQAAEYFFSMTHSIQDHLNPESILTATGKANAYERRGLLLNGQRLSFLILKSEETDFRSVVSHMAEDELSFLQGALQGNTALWYEAVIEMRKLGVVIPYPVACSI